MNLFINLSTNEFPLYEGDVRLVHPEIATELTGDTFPTPEGFAKVLPTNPPIFDASKQTLEPVKAEKINGVWTQIWPIRDLTTEEIEAIAAAKALHEKELAELEAKINQNTSSTTVLGATSSDEFQVIDPEPPTVNVTILNP